MTFLPAPANTGIRFRRVDLEGKPEIEARVENVVENNRSTTLAKGNTRIHTVEHVLAAFAGYGIDNAIIELDANEPPIADGSSREYLQDDPVGGHRAADRTLRSIQGDRADRTGDGGDRNDRCFPDAGSKSPARARTSKRGSPSFTASNSRPPTWERELAHARTFCFYEEIEYLIKNGLIKGGSLENAVVIRDDAVLTNEPLRYPEEFVRHKILDIVGDLSLLGRPLRGHLIAVKPGHAANCELVRRVLAQMRRPLAGRADLWTAAGVPEPRPNAGGRSNRGGRSGRRHGHRPDHADCCRIGIRSSWSIGSSKFDGNFITGVKNVTINEMYFQGHFPGHPIMPGVMQLEAIAQVAGILMIKRAESRGQLAYFMSAEDVKWRKPVYPGDVLVIDVELIKIRGKIGKAKGVCKVRGDVVSEAAVTFMLRADQ